MKPGSEPTTVEAFCAAWAKECDEWMQIRADMLVSAAPDETVTAYDVSLAQRKAMLSRGEVSVIESAFARILIGAPGVCNDTALERTGG